MNSGKYMATRNYVWMAMTVLLCVILLYFFYSYSAIFKRSTAYIYHPETDLLYRMEMAPYLDNYIDPIVPFKRLRYVLPYYSETVGTLKEIEASQDDFINRRDVYLEKIVSRSQETTEKIKDGSYEYITIQYYRRNNVDFNKNIESVIPGVSDFFNVDCGYLPCVMSIDAIVVTRNLKKDPPVYDILTDAVLFRGNAAYVITQFLEPVK